MFLPVLTRSNHYSVQCMHIVYNDVYGSMAPFFTGIFLLQETTAISGDRAAVSRHSLPRHATVNRRLFFSDTELFFVVAD